MIYRTFDEWNSDGYLIIKGEKAVDRDINGVPLFSEDQVTCKSNNYYNNYSDYNDVDYDDPMSFDTWMFS